MNTNENISHNKTSAKERIEQAFVNLIKENEIEKITVNQLVERAGVCKTTFYRNFRDVYDVLDSLISALVDRSVEVAMAILSGGLGFEDIISSIAEGDFCPHIFPHTNNDTLIIHYAINNKDIRIPQLLMNKLITVFSDSIHVNNVSKEDIRFYCKFFIQSIFTGYVDDLQRGKKFDTDLLLLAYEYIEALKKSGESSNV